MNKFNKPNCTEKKACEYLGIDSATLSRWKDLKIVTTNRKNYSLIEVASMPTPEEAKKILKEEKKKPPSYFTTGYFLKKEIYQRGWPRGDVEFFLGQPDWISGSGYKVFHRYQKRRVLEFEEAQLAECLKLKKWLEEKGFTPPEPDNPFFDNYLKIVISQKQTPFSHYKGSGNSWKFVFGEQKFSIDFTQLFPKSFAEAKSFLPILRKHEKEFSQKAKSLKNDLGSIKDELYEHYAPADVDRITKTTAIKDDTVNVKKLIKGRLDDLYKKRRLKELHEEIALDAFHKTFQTGVRKTIGIFGPTNSGKTYQAFEALKKAKSGVYLAPLRLMAAEGWSSLKDSGVPCSLVTGEERIYEDNAQHTCSTVEMLPAHECEVAVIDEAQMLADPFRGGAWTNAILGVKAKTVYILGAPNCEQAVRDLLALKGEFMETIHTERFTPLRVTDNQKVTQHSAFIVFSRFNALKAKEEFPHSSIIYGNLSPEVRRKQAENFSSGKVRTLIATDAIGMGLNLPIQKIIFSTLTKWDGKEERELTSDEIKQIAGRAGRFGKFEEGLVSAPNPEMRQDIKEALEEPYEQIPSQFRVNPNWEIVSLISERLNTDLIQIILNVFAKIKSKPPFCVADLNTMLALSELIDRTSMSLSDKFKFVTCPIQHENSEQLQEWFYWAKQFQNGENMTYKTSFEKFEFTNNYLKWAENEIKICKAYHHICFKYPHHTTDFQKVQLYIEQLNQNVLKILSQRVKKSCKKCGCELPLNYRHGYCEACWEDICDEREFWR